MTNQLIDQALVDFISSRKLIVLATVDESGKPWISNMYYSTDKDLTIYLVTAPSTQHSKHVKQNPEVAFSIPWFDENNLGNRKAIQGRGVCTRVTNLKETIKALSVHLKKYPDWKSVINLKNMQNKVIDSRMYKIKPTYMKFWNDELYGDEGVREFKF